MVALGVPKQNVHFSFKTLYFTVFWNSGLRNPCNLHGSLSVCSKNISFYHAFEHLQYFLRTKLFWEQNFWSVSRMFISFLKRCILQCFGTVALGIYGNLHGSLSVCSKNISFYTVFEHLQFFLSVILRDPCKFTWIPQPGRTTNWTLLDECSFCTFFTRFLSVLLQKPQFLHCFWTWPGRAWEHYSLPGRTTNCLVAPLIAWSRH